MQVGVALMAKSVPDGSTDQPPKKRAPRKLPTSDIPADDLQAVFGRNLRLARLKRGLTLVELAEMAGMAFRYVSDVENGQKNLTLATMKRLARVIDHDVGGMLQVAEAEVVAEAKAEPASPSRQSQKKGA